MFGDLTRLGEHPIFAGRVGCGGDAGGGRSAFGGWIMLDFWHIFWWRVGSWGLTRHV